MDWIQVFVLAGSNLLVAAAFSIDSWWRILRISKRRDYEMSETERIDKDAHAREMERMRVHHEHTMAVIRAYKEAGREPWQE